MKICVLGAGIADQKSNLESLQSRPAFRKATRNMQLSCFAIEQAIQALPADQRDQTALILGSGLGELDITQQFLSTLATSKMARPILFQSSLHNATIGFLSIQLGMTGPSFTVSNGPQTGENCLELACSLLQNGDCLYSLVVGVDSKVPSFDVDLGEGAGAVLLTTEKGLLPSHRPLGWMGDLQRVSLPFDSAAIYCMAEGFLQVERQPG